MIINKNKSDMWQLIERLWPICRSITGNGLRESLKIIQEQVPIQLTEVPSGSKVFDWEIPKEWNIKDAYVLNEMGEKIIDFKLDNLHVVGYSKPVNGWFELDELQNHLHSLVDQPDAIPYVTSYYKEYWGICLSHNQRKKLQAGKYFVYIESEFSNGSLTYGECKIAGESKKEIFLSTYVCHPSMANNELSGPAVLTEIAKWLSSEKRKYSYRMVFIPETIGSISYLAKNLVSMKENIIAGFNLSCLGDNNNYSYVESRHGNTYPDRLVRRIMKANHPQFKQFSFLERGSDERQYCSPGVDLPMVGLSRTKYGEYPEYHTSLDNLSYICEEGLQGSFELIKQLILEIEKDKFYKIKVLCEPQLGKRNLYPTLSTKTSVSCIKRMMNFIAYADGSNSLVDIADKTSIPLAELEEYVHLLLKQDLIEEL